MALNLRGLRGQITAAVKPYPAAEAAVLEVQAIDEGNATGRPWQAFRVLSVDVDQEKNPTAVVLTIKPIPGAHG